jgi:hypothetical protein
VARQIAVAGRFLLAQLLASMLLDTAGRAGETWDGGGINNNWTNAVNWDSDRIGRDETYAHALSSR